MCVQGEMFVKVYSKKFIGSIWNILVDFGCCYKHVLEIHFVHRRIEKVVVVIRNNILAISVHWFCF